MRKIQTSGITLIEVVVAISIVAIMVITIGFSITTYVDARAQLLNNVTKMYLAEDGYETIRAIRDIDWNTIDALTNGTRYHLDISTTSVAIGGTTEIIDGLYYRSFVVQPVARDASDDIVSSTTPGSTIDTNARELYVSVSDSFGTSTFTIILTNIDAI